MKIMNACNGDKFERIDVEIRGLAANSDHLKMNS